MLQRLANALERRMKLFYILPEDISKINESLLNILTSLACNGVKRIDADVSVGENYSPIEISGLSGYWIDDTIRIDIKVKKNG